MTFCATNLKVYHAIVDMNQTSFCPQNCKLSQMQLLSLTGNWDLISQIRKALKGQVSEWESNQGNNWGEKLFKYFSWRLILLKLRDISLMLKNLSFQIFFLEHGADESRDWIWHVSCAVSLNLTQQHCLVCLVFYRQLTQLFYIVVSVVFYCNQAVLHVIS